MQQVAVDASVFVSYLTGRHEKQYNAAHALLQEAEDRNIVAILPQFVVFEVSYVLQSLYNLSGELELWPDPLPGLADASIVAVATTNRYDAVATFDRKLTNKLESFGLAAYW